jgi:hypothetical protein
MRKRNRREKTGTGQTGRKKRVEEEMKGNNTGKKRREKRKKKMKKNWKKSQKVKGQKPERK